VEKEQRAIHIADRRRGRHRGLPTPRTSTESSAFSLAVVRQEREEDHLRRGEDELLYRRARVAAAATHKAGKTQE
jgi:hypothetical protein